MFQDTYMTTLAKGHYHPAWPYDHFEHPREAPLDICPSTTCRQRKACCSAYRDKFCLRLFKTTEEMRGDLAVKLERMAAQYSAEERDSGIVMKKQKDRKRGLARLKRCLMEREQTEFAQIDADWKGGKLDVKYGPYSPKGFFRPPPLLEYVEVIRNAKGDVIAEKRFGRVQKSRRSMKKP
jgi:hypothetical protein